MSVPRPRDRSLLMQLFYPDDPAFVDGYLAEILKCMKQSQKDPARNTFSSILIEETERALHGVHMLYKLGIILLLMQVDPNYRDIFTSSDNPQRFQRFLLELHNSFTFFASGLTLEGQSFVANNDRNERHIGVLVLHLMQFYMKL